jgi:DNA-binding MarR family transcriptional regulator
MTSVIQRQLGYELRLAELAWRKNLEGPLRELGLTLPQYSTLRALQQAPGASSAELARSALVTPQSMNALVLQLEQAQLITRTTSTTNLRVLNAELTPSGKTLLTKASRLVRRLESVAVTDLSESEHRQLLDLLTRCTAALEHAAPSRALSS